MLACINTLGRANTQVRPYENDTTGRVKLVGADLCVCPDYRRLSDDTHKNKPKKTLSWINALGRANTQVRPYENDTAGRVKLVGADLCVCPDYLLLSDDTYKTNRKRRYHGLTRWVGRTRRFAPTMKGNYLCHTILTYIIADLFD